MNSKKILIMLAMIVTIGLVYFQLNDDVINPESKVDLVKTESELLKADVKSKNKNKIKPKPKLDQALLHIAQLISPPSDKELKDTWEEEYTCNGKEKCNNFIFNARSYEDALWLKRKGYPTQSMVKLLRDLSQRDLWELSNNGNVNAKNLLALNALRHKNIKTAKSYGRSSMAHSAPGETFGYRLLAEALLMDKDPMVATLYLRMASILGDTNATATYERITAGTASLVIDSTNRIAYSYLTERLNTSINNLNNDPRPTDHGGG